MIKSDGFYQIILFFIAVADPYAIAIMSNERDRVISITLSEAEWQAFVARQPQPVTWLRDRIRDEVRDEDRGEVRAAATERQSAA
jgi:hypothetical protein